jgi:hemerythrin
MASIMGKETVLRVLRRAGDDYGFLAQLSEDDSRALENDDLNWEEKAAIMNREVRWIENHVRKPDQDLMTWLDCRLQQKKWS